MYPILLWALVALIGRVHCKCSLAPIVDDEQSIAYACIHSDLSDLDDISSKAKWIEFSVSRFQHIPENTFSRFTDLRRLSFYNCFINSISDDAFSGLHRLDWLIFHGTRIEVARATWFRHMPNLRRLALDRCGLVHLEPDVFRMIPRLETLGLRDNDLNCLSIEELSYLRQLKTVRIDGNPWLCECRQRMERFFRDRSIVQEEECLTEIDVHRHVQCMTQVGFPILMLPSTTQHVNTFETSVLNSLDRLPEKTTWIEIRGLRIDRIPNYTFFRFGNSLRSLDLNDCLIGTIESNAFAGLHKLERLSLVGNRLPVLGSDWFLDLIALQHLILQRNEIERIETSAFRNLGDSLQYLDISNNRLRCLSTEVLDGLSKLYRFNATGNPWTCTCRKDLESFLTSRNIGFWISAGTCYENEAEIPEVTDGWRQHQTNTTSWSQTGRVQWNSFEESVKEVNMTIVRPTITPPTIRVDIKTPRPPVYDGTCHPDTTDRSAHQVYICSGITSFEVLYALPPNVHTIRIVSSNLRKIPANAFASFNGYLDTLELRDCGIREIERGAFSGLYRLTHLSLQGNQLESITSEMVEGIGNLRHLDLSQNQIHRITIDAVKALPHLISLDVSENRMNCISVEHIACCLRYLSTFKVSGNPWSCLCGTNLANLLDSRRIPYNRTSLINMNEECHGSRPSITTTTWPKTTVILPTPAPTPAWNLSMEIEGTCVSYDDASGTRYRCTNGNLLLLQAIPPNATAIEFHEGHLPHLPAEIFSRFVNLRELVISNSGLKTIEERAFDGLEKLEYLAIQDNPLGTIGQSWLVLSNLEKLDLRGNSIKYIAPGAFRHLTHLSYLNLEGNDLKCIFTSDLNDMQNVHVIEFSGNPLKWRCRVELEQFLEARRIKFVKIENSCEGKKLVRHLLYQNRTDGDLECSSECSAATTVGQSLLIFFVVLTFSTISIREIDII